MTKGRKRLPKSAGLVTAAALALAGLSACTSGGGTDKTSTIKITNVDEGWQKAFQLAAKDYEKAHPGTKVEVNGIPYDKYQAVLQTQLVAKSGADLLFVEPPAATAFAGSGFLQPLDSELAKDSTWKSAYNDGALDAVKGADGKQYLAPWSAVAVLLAYHDDLYKKAGLTGSPKNWDEWIAGNQKLKAIGLDPLYVSLKGDDATTWWLLVNKLNAVFRPLTKDINLISKTGFSFDPNDISSTTGEAYTTDELYVAFKKGLIDPAKSDAYRRAVELTAQISPFLNKNTASVSPTDTAGQFNTAKAPQLIGVGRTLAETAATMKKAGATPDVKTLDLPTMTQANFAGLTAGEENPLTGPRNGWVVNKAGKNVKGAIDFVKFISSPKEVSKIYAVLPQGDPSLVKGVTYPADSVMTSVRPLKYAEINAYGFGGAPTFDAQDFDEFNAQWQKFLTGKSNIDEFLKDRSASNLGALERNLKLNADSIDQKFIDTQLGK